MNEILHSGCFHCGSETEPVLTSLMRTVESQEKKRVDGVVKEVAVKKATSIALCSGCTALPIGHVFKQRKAA